MSEKLGGIELARSRFCNEARGDGVGKRRKLCVEDAIANWGKLPLVSPSAHWANTVPATVNSIPL